VAGPREVMFALAAMAVLVKAGLGAGILRLAQVLPRDER
jgi:hypothetical protein